MNSREKDDAANPQNNSQIPEGDGGLRLQVYLSHSGVASRRAAVSLIEEGRVTVNGARITAPGEKVSHNDIVCLDGKQIFIEDQFLYLALNKPPEFICSSSDPQGRALALDLLREKWPALRLYNIGRLDFRSSGLILFTNDGDFAARVGHPRAEIEKEYLIDASSIIPDKVVEDFSRGLLVEGVLYRAHFIERIGRKSLRIVLLEGKNREIRRVFSHFHLHPTRLQRIRIGPVELGSLAEGDSRKLTETEMAKLRSIHGNRN